MQPEFVTLINDIAKTYATRLVNSLSCEETRLVSKEAKLTGYQAQYQQELSHYVTCIATGLREIVPRLLELAPFEPEIFTESVQDELQKLCQDEVKLENWALLSLINDAEVIPFHLSEGALQGLYRIGASFYNSGSYLQAARVYLILTLINHENAAFWMALGDAEFYNQAYANALYAYAASSRQDPTDPAPHFYAARCYEELKQYSLANNSLDVLLTLVDGEEDNEGWIERARSYKEQLSVGSS